MASPERYDAYTLMEQFCDDTAALGDALTLFHRPARLRLHLARL